MFAARRRFASCEHRGCNVDTQALRGPREAAPDPIASHLDQSRVATKLEPRRKPRNRSMGGGHFVLNTGRQCVAVVKPGRESGRTAVRGLRRTGTDHYRRSIVVASLAGDATRAACK